MPELKTLREELASVTKQATAILEDRGENITSEDRKQVDELITKSQLLREQIDTKLSDDERVKALQGHATYLGEAQRRLPHGLNESDGPTQRKMLESKGWEFPNGLALAPTSQGKTVEMYGEDVLFGPLPTDDTEARKYFKSTRASFEPIYRDAYLKFMRTACKTRNESMAFSMLSPDEQKALSEGSDTAGGFLVPPDVQAEMLVRLPQLAIMRKYATVQTTSRDMLRWPRVQANSAYGSIYSSGFVGGWVGETPAFSDTDPAFGTFDIMVKKLRVATKLSNDFVADAAVNILAWLAQNGAANMALTEDQGFIAGDGAALQPLGVLNSGLTTVDVEGSTANTISNTSAAAGSAPKIIDLTYALPSQYLPNARWVMRRSVEGHVRKLIDNSGRFLWPAVTASGFAAVAREIMGYPVDNSEWMPIDDTDANKVLLFGDLSAYVIAQRAQMSTVVLRERFADTDQVGLIVFERVGGALWNVDAVRVGIT